MNYCYFVADVKAHYLHHIFSVFDVLKKGTDAQGHG